MSCGCGDNSPRREILRNIRHPRPERFGGVALAKYPDCDRTYKGRWEGESVFVVGRGDVATERLFKRSQLDQASDYTKEIDGILEPVAVANMCHQAIADLYEPAV